jgi:hypothetical protein
LQPALHLAALMAWVDETCARVSYEAPLYGASAL